MAKDDNPVEEVAVAPEKETPEPPKEEKPEAPQEPLKEEESEEPQEEELTSEEEGEEEAPAPMSKRKAERLAKLESLVDRLKGDETPAEAPKATGMDYGKDLQADDETIARLEADRQAASATSFNEGLERAKSIQFHTRLEIDAPRIEGKYPILDKESSDFKPATADAINRWYLASVGYNAQTDTVANPKLRYADFVEGLMELVDSTAGVKVENTKKNIAKQAAATSLRPDGSAAKMNLNKAPQDMTDDELKAVIKRGVRSLK